MSYSVFEEFCTEIGIDLQKNVDMSRHSGFKTGGNADLFLAVDSVDTLSVVFETAKALGIPVFILGKGSNILVSDLGIEGLVISLSGMDGIEINGNTVTAGAGTSLTALCVAVANAGLSGLEFAYGIPGSVGGALYMNAGAYGGEIADVVTKARYLDGACRIKAIEKEDMRLGYRTSIFKEKVGVITEATFKLTPAPKEEIWEQMSCLMEKRKSKQPLNFPSAGSTFKRPEGYFAGALIEENGFKGQRVGGAMVSEKHAGFVINYENATTEDILRLINKIKATVSEKNGVNLETEVIFVGREQ